MARGAEEPAGEEEGEEKWDVVIWMDGLIDGVGADLRSYGLGKAVCRGDLVVHI